MPFIDWSDNLSVKISSLDTQHQKLIAMLNEFYDAMKAGKGKEALGGILSSLITYTRNHFATEERLMNTYEYPSRLAHKKEHDELTAKVLDLDKKFKEGKTSISIEVLNFLKEWLQKHIIGSDKNYGPFFAAKGLK